MYTVKLKIKGGWIDASYDEAVLTLACVGPPLQFIVKPPTSIPGRHKQTEERARFRRLAITALQEAGAPSNIDEADVAWTYRAG